MEFLKRLFGSKKDKTNSTSNENKDTGGTPIIESLEFLTHVKTVKSEFNFLAEDLGFQIINNDWHGREHITLFELDNIQVEVIFTPGSLPYVKLRNTNLPYDESKNLFNTDLVEYFNPEIAKIRHENGKRRKPIYNKAMEKWRKEDLLDFSELEKDYADNGRIEHIELLEKSSKTVRKMINNKQGVLNSI